MRIGTRGSALALWQARHVAARLAGLAPGRADRARRDHLAPAIRSPTCRSPTSRAPASSRPRSSARCRPATWTSPCTATRTCRSKRRRASIVAAVPPRGPVEDVLCARDGCTLATLPRGARVGTCSTRRTAQVRPLAPTSTSCRCAATCRPASARIASGELDAVVLARAGLERLGLERHITEVFPAGRHAAGARRRARWPCSAAQADRDCARCCRRSTTRRRAAPSQAERARAARAGRRLLRAGGRGRRRVDGGDVDADGRRLRLDGTRRVRAEGRGIDPDAVGAAAARRLLEQGAGAILAACRSARRLEPGGRGGAS